MKEEFKERAIMFGKHIAETKHTVRKTAEIFGISKSTVHKDVSVKLKKVHPKLFLEVKEILKNNFEEKHIRGGKSTKEKHAARLQNKGV